MARSFKLTRFTCFFCYLAMSSVFALPPLLFVTFRELYDISYTLLGTLVLVNFCTQLTIDLIFTFFSKHFNIKLTLRIMPLLTATGLLVYALIPALFPDIAYLGLVIGTVIFSVAAGLCEVLLSPLVAALPSETPEKDMSLLHSLYAWGVLFNITVATLYLQFVPQTYWYFLPMLSAILPIMAAVLFSLSPLPPLELSQPIKKEGGKHRTVGLLLCVLCIFLGSSAENVMTNWISSFAEAALSIPKLFGDIFGMALFALLLGIVRTLYAKYGRRIDNVLLVSMIGAAICYLIAGLVTNTYIAFAACILMGIFTSMLWPGTLILMEEKMAGLGVAAYALMAAGGDFGASLAPQLTGVIIDAVSAGEFAKTLAERLSLTPEQIGMKVGMITAALFPIFGIAVVLGIKRYFKKTAAERL